MTQLPLAELETRLGYKFANQPLLQQSLTHASFSGPTASYERNFWVTGCWDFCWHIIFMNIVQMIMKALSLRLHSEARTATLAMVARKLNIADFLQTQPGMCFAENERWRMLLSQFFAAIYLDSGLDDAAAFLQSALAACQQHRPAVIKMLNRVYKNGRWRRDLAYLCIGNLPNLARIMPRN